MSQKNDIDLSIVKEILKEHGYVLESDQEIGKGMFTKVYSGKNCVTNSVVCIKVQRDSFDRGVMCEYQNTSNLPCYERIMKPVKFIQDSDYNISICKKGEQNLDHLIKTTVIDLLQLKQITLDILLSLLTMYVEGVTHTDIKLANILKCNDKFVLIDWSSDMKVKSIQYSSPYYSSGITFEMQNMIEIYKSGVYLCGVSINELCTQMQKAFNNIEFDSFKAINTQFLLINNPYLRYSLIEVIDQYYIYFGEKNMSAYLQYERERVISLIDQLEEQIKQPYRQLAVYYFYLSKISKNKQRIKYLKKSLKCIEEMKKIKIQQQGLCVDEAHLYLELAKYYLHDYDLNRASFEVLNGLKAIENSDQFSFTVYIQLIKCLAEILYENKSYLESFSLIERIFKQVEIFYGPLNMLPTEPIELQHNPFSILTIELELLLILSEMQIHFKREQHIQLIRLDKICEEFFFNYPIQAKVKIGLAKYAEKEKSHFQIYMIEEAEVIYMNLFEMDSIEMAELDDLKSDYYFTQGLYTKALHCAQNAFNKKSDIFKDDFHPLLAQSLKRITRSFLLQDLILEAQISCETELKIRANEKIYDPNSLAECYETYIEIIEQINSAQQNEQFLKENSNIYELDTNIFDESSNKSIYQLIQKRDEYKQKHNDFTENLLNIYQQAFYLQESERILLKFDLINWFQRSTNQKEFEIIPLNHQNKPEIQLQQPGGNGIRVRSKMQRRIYSDEIQPSRQFFLDENKEIHHDQQNQIYQPLSRRIQHYAPFQMESFVIKSFRFFEQSNINQQNYSGLKSSQIKMEVQNIDTSSLQRINEKSKNKNNLSCEQDLQKINAHQSPRDNHSNNSKVQLNIDVSNQILHSQFDQNSHHQQLSSINSQMDVILYQNDYSKSQKNNYSKHKKDSRNSLKKSYKGRFKYPQLKLKRILKISRAQYIKFKTKNSFYYYKQPDEQNIEKEHQLSDTKKQYFNSN